MNYVKENGLGSSLYIPRELPDDISIMTSLALARNEQNLFPSKAAAKKRQQQEKEKQEGQASTFSAAAQSPEKRIGQERRMTTGPGSLSPIVGLLSGKFRSEFESHEERKH